VYRVRLTPEAKHDLRSLRTFIGKRSSATVASSYVSRISSFISGLDAFPERGTMRDEIRPGLRMIGFERRVTVAFLVDGEDVVILRILYASRQFDVDLA
jgi:plasmid stabilization system protein ParE